MTSVCLMLTAVTKFSSTSLADDFFESRIRPLLIERCLECHGAEKQSGGLRLDSAEGLAKGGDSGAAIIPGDAAASRLVQAIRYDGDLQMPPENPLSEDEKAALTHWVQQGAVWPKSIQPLMSAVPSAAKTHWAFQPVVRPAVPKSSTVESQNPIDAFLLARLEQAQLPMSPESDRRTLIRRLSYSLTGLPPAAASVDAFVNDQDPQAYEKLVDQLLASTAYGEHWARHWLDVARYSDTKGYVYAREERFWIHAWSYRDWVIRSLNSDMPYNRFLLLQIAADQVADRGETDLAAMGFLTLGRRFLGVRRDIIDDHIDVVCRGTMSLTVGCARCHDHKYDPIPTADYYSLYGVFDSSRETQVPLTDSTQGDEAFQKELTEKLTAMEASRQGFRDETQARVRARVGDYLRAQLDLGRYPESGFDQIIAATDLLPSFVHRWRDYLRDTQRNDDPVFAAWHAYRQLSAEEFSDAAPRVNAELLTRDPARLNPRIARVFAAPPTSFDDVITRYTQVFQDVDQLWQTAVTSAKAANQSVPDSLEDPSDEQIRQVLYEAGKPCHVPDEPVVSTEYDFDSDICNKLWKQQVELDRLILNAPSQPAFAVILKDRQIPVTPRIFKRGNSANKGDDVPRQFLSLLSGPDRKPFQIGSGRLELAQAIIDPKNPLTARVMVNRVWARHFGTGLVSSQGDFGLRADPPSHPELLDWLASEFLDSGWSLKHIHRLIVTSAAFRQTSHGSDDPAVMERAQSIDPGNRLLWRMNPHRLSFEEMRDSMLFASGKLETVSGGRPVELFKAPYPRRRTIFGLVDRQFLPGTLRMFDFANPDLHIPQRSETTVPQQSLFLMNHPLVLDQARQLAATAKQHAGTEDPAVLVEHLYQLTLQRRPTNAQLSESVDLLQTETPETPVVSPTVADWSYGYGSLDETAQRVTSFTPLPHFTGTAWQGGPSFPDGPLGWVQLTATGGHPGNDRQHAAIRRWTAPHSMTLKIDSEVNHEPQQGDGIRVFVVSSRHGVLSSGKAHQQKLPVMVESVSVEAGETLDFVVDIGDVLNSDQYFWRCQLIPMESTAEKSVTWNSEADFPSDTTQLLTPLEQLAQVLLCSNEFLFID